MNYISCDQEPDSKVATSNNAMCYKSRFQDFPHGPVVESPCQCRGHGFCLWPGKLPHAQGQLSSYIQTAGPVLQSLRTTAGEATTVRSLLTAPGEQPVLAATRESPLAANKIVKSGLQSSKKKFCIGCVFSFFSCDEFPKAPQQISQRAHTLLLSREPPFCLVAYFGLI